MQEQHVSPLLSALVALAAIATTFTTYTYYNDEQVASRYDESRDSLDQAASILMSLRIENQQATTTEADIKSKQE